MPGTDAGARNTAPDQGGGAGQGGLKHAGGSSARDTPNVPLWCVDYAEPQALKKQQGLGAASSEPQTPNPIWPQADPPRTAPATRDPRLVVGEEADVDTTLRQTLSQTVLPPICSSKGPFAFP